jgi:hypothetical protein
MKTELFKKLIKEAIREVLKEELPGLVRESKQDLNLIGKPYPPSVNLSPNGTTAGRTEVNTTARVSIQDMLEQTRKTMNKEEFRSIMESTVQAPGLGMQSLDDSEFTSTPAPGLDISNLDFVKKAASVYNASVEKDKLRLG